MRTTSPLTRKRGGSKYIPTPLGVPVRIRSPGSSVNVSRRKSTISRDAEDQVAGARVLAQLAVDPRAQREVAGLRTSSAVVIHGPNGHEPSKPFARVHCRSAPLEVARGQVVGHRIARDLAVGAHDDRQLALVVQAPDDGRRVHRRARRGHRAGQLHEDDRHLRQLGVLLLRMGEVVQADAEDRARDVGREQLDLVERVVGAGRGRAIAGGQAILAPSSRRRRPTTRPSRTSPLKVSPPGAR